MTAFLYNVNINIIWYLQYYLFMINIKVTYRVNTKIDVKTSVGKATILRFYVPWI